MQYEHRSAKTCIMALAMCVAMSAAALMAASASAAEYTWNGTSGGAWTDASSWTPSTAYPDGDDTAIFVYDASVAPPATFTGIIRSVGGRVTLTGPVSSAVEMRTDGGGEISISGAATIGALSGGSPAGRVRASGNLEVSGSAAAATNEFAGAVSGAGGFVKSGADYALVLSGHSDYEGATGVAAGTLCLRRPAARRGLVAQWTFDDPGNLCADSGPSGIDLTTAGTGGQVAAGVGGRPAIQLWTGQYLSVPKASVTAANGFFKRNSGGAVSLWIKPNLARSSAQTYLVQRGNWTARQMFSMWLNAQTKQLRLSLDAWTKTSDSLNVYATAVDIGDGDWHHLVGSFGDGKLQLWYDGTLLGESSYTGELSFEKAIETATSGFTFGSSENGHGLEGALDDICIWNHRLSADEVAREFALRGEPDFGADALPAPVAHYKFDDDANPGLNSAGTGDIAVHAPSSSATLSTEYFPFGKALAGAAMSGAMPTGMPTGQAAFTLSVRMLPTSSANGLSFFFWGSDWSNLFLMKYSGTPSRLGIEIRKQSSQYNFSSASTDSNSLSDCNWVTWTVTYNPKSHVLRLYRDGVLDMVNNDVWCDLPTAGDIYLNWQLSLGNSKANHRFDDLRIYDCELTPNEVKTLVRSLETGADRSVLPVGSAVTVAANAVLEVEGGIVCTNAVSGTGAVVLKNGSCLMATDWSGFTGSVSGVGELVVARGCSGPASANVSVRASFQDGVVSVSRANLTTPMIRTSGKVYLRDAMRVELAPGSGLDDVSGNTYKLAECSGVIGAPDSSGWTIDSRYSAWNQAPKATLRFNNGLLTLRVSSVGMVITFR